MRCRVVAACSRLAVIHVTFTTRSEKVEASTWAVVRIGETIPVCYLLLIVLINRLIIKKFCIYIRLAIDVFKFWLNQNWDFKFVKEIAQKELQCNVTLKNCLLTVPFLCYQVIQNFSKRSFFPVIIFIINWKQYNRKSPTRRRHFHPLREYALTFSDWIERKKRAWTCWGMPRWRAGMPSLRNVSIIARKKDTRFLRPERQAGREGKARFAIMARSRVDNKGSLAASLS